MADDEKQETERSEHDTLDIEEPTSAVRLSPYAIAAFVLSALSLWLSPQSLFPPFDFVNWRMIVFGLMPELLPALGAAVTALWIAGRAEEEILRADGRLGGVGFYRSARIVVIVTLAVLAIGIGLRWVGGDPFAAEYEIADEAPEDAEFFPPPPALPAEPALPAFPAEPGP